MDLSELRRVQRKERSTDSLQELRASFYADVAEYIQSLREERSEAAAAAEDPFRSTKVTDLTKEIETAEHIAEAIYQRRIGKLVDEASLSATGTGGDKAGLTAEEQDLYDDLVARIEANKADVLDQFAGEHTPGDVSDDDSTDSSSTDDSFDPESTAAPDESGTGTTSESETKGGTSPADAMGADLETDEGATDESGEEQEDGDESADVDRTTVRMTADVGEIFGVDAESYDLKRDDIVDLPTENADPLVDRDAAERID